MTTVSNLAPCKQVASGAANGRYFAMKDFATNMVLMMKLAEERRKETVNRQLCQSSPDDFLPAAKSGNPMEVF